MRTPTHSGPGFQIDAIFSILGPAPSVGGDSAPLAWPSNKAWVTPTESEDDLLLFFKRFETVDVMPRPEMPS